MKKIAVVAIEKEYAKSLFGDLIKSLGKYAEFTYYALNEIEKLDYLEEDFVIIATFTIFKRVEQKLRKGAEIIVITVAPNKEMIAPLKELEKGTRALLVNYDYRTCIQSITNLYAAGLNNLEMIPYYGEDNYDKAIRIAITPNESRMVPKGIETVIDIGESVIDYNSLYRIAEKLGIQESFTLNEGIEAKRTGGFLNLNVERMLGENVGLSEKVNTLIKLINQGIILTDTAGNILSANEKAKKILKSREELFLGFKVWEILPEIFDVITNDIKDNSFEEVICVDEKNIIVSIHKIIRDKEIYGTVITLDDFEEVEEKQHGIRTKLNNISHIARYDFENILGNSVVMQETIAVAKRMAKSEASIMITGESGTGKEVFAQSIHNQSTRNKYNFVAVNCAAIPENLLESEMFGYEEGSFTGAKKGGKTGYFELAHKGTIFLDEIGEMPLALQSKLLRVIEERNIMKVGSDKPISIDVRIICATNKDLYKLVSEGLFREDLYYRINVLPLWLPPLRERKEDVYPLIVNFMKKTGKVLKLSEDVKSFLENYYWQGNVRELRNVVEYITSLEKNNIDINDLPPYQKKKSINTGMEYLDDKDKDKIYIMADAKTRDAEVGLIKMFNTLNSNEKQLILNEYKNLDLLLFVLEMLTNAFEGKTRVGRRSLEKMSLEQGKNYSEGEIRAILKEMEMFGMIRSGKGRSGSTITSTGMELYQKISKQKI